MGLSSWLVDRARVASDRPGAGGRLARVQSAWFRARLIDGPRPSSDPPEREWPASPTLLCRQRGPDGEPLEFGHGDRVEIDSRELGASEWRVSGSPTVLRKRRAVIGLVVPLERAGDPGEVGFS